jgi:hypothetical protein
MGPPSNRVRVQTASLCNDWTTSQDSLAPSELLKYFTVPAEWIRSVDRRQQEESCILIMVSDELPRGAHQVPIVVPKIGTEDIAVLLLYLTLAAGARRTELVEPKKCERRP